MTGFLELSLRNTFCVSMGKTLGKPHHMSINGFFQGKQHLVPAVHPLMCAWHAWVDENEIQTLWENSRYFMQFL